MTDVSRNDVAQRREIETRRAVPSPVRVDAFLADAVGLHDGKLDMVGGAWTHLVVPSLPARRRGLGLALLLRVPAWEAPRPVSVSLRLDAPDGARIALGPDGEYELDGVVTPGPAVDGSPLGEATIPLAVAVDGLTLPVEGRYRFVIAIDGVDAKLVPFAVLRAQDEPASAA